MGNLKQIKYVLAGRGGGVGGLTMTDQSLTHVLNGLLKPIFGPIFPHSRRPTCRSWPVLMVKPSWQNELGVPVNSS